MQLFKSFINRNQKVISIMVGGIFLFYLNLLFAMPNYAIAGTRAVKSKVSTSVFAHLQSAKVAQEAGQTERAQHHWSHAKRLDPSLTKPAWLLTEASAAFPVAISERQLLLTQLPELSDPNRKEKLEEHLKVNPLDEEVRSALLDIAKRQGDKAAEQRHQSVLTPETRPLPRTYVKLGLLAFLIGGIVWGIFAPLPGSNNQSLAKLMFKFLLNSMKSQ